MVGVSSIITSFFTYFQSLGSTVSMKNINLPEGLKQIASFFSDIINSIKRIIPKMPQFDSRFQLALLSLGIPVFLDIIFVWLISPLLKIVFHIADLGVLCICVYYLVYAFYEHYVSTGTYIIGSISVVYLIIRVIYLSLHTKFSSGGYGQLAKQICSYRLGDIVPGLSENISIKEISEAVKKFSKVVEIVPKPPTLARSLIMFFVDACLVFFGILPSLGFKNWQIPAFLKIVCPICLAIGIIAFIVFFLQFFRLGQKIIMSIKNFIKRWGLRLLMMALDCLYIPILTQLIANLVPKSIYCDENEYLKYQRVPAPGESSILYAIVNHTAICAPCFSVLQQNNPQCAIACSGISELRNAANPSLLYERDEIAANGGLMLYTFFFVIIGVPILWAIIIYRNRNFVISINTWGETADQKWQYITCKLKTTGIFIFYNFHIRYTSWNIIVLFFKFGIMTITTVTSVVSPYICLVLPIFHILIAGIYIFCRPYLFVFNNFLDTLLYIVNAVVAILPVLTLFGVTVKNSWSIPLVIVCALIPFVSLTFLLFFRKNNLDPDDPTLVLDPDSKLGKAHHKNLAEKKMEKERQKELFMQQYKEDRRAARRAMESDFHTPSRSEFGNEEEYFEEEQGNAVISNGDSGPSQLSQPSEYSQPSESSESSESSEHSQSFLDRQKRKENGKSRKHRSASKDTRGRSVNEKLSDESLSDLSEASLSTQERALPPPDENDDQKLVELPEASNVTKERGPHRHHANSSSQSENDSDSAPNGGDGMNQYRQRSRADTVLETRSDESENSEFSDTVDEMNENGDNFFEEFGIESSGSDLFESADEFAIKMDEDMDGKKKKKEEMEDANTMVKIYPYQICTIMEALYAEEAKKKHKNNDESSSTIEEVPFYVKRSLLAKRMQSLNQMIDTLVDGSTIELLSNILSIAVMVGAIVGGWYACSIVYNAEHGVDLYCG